MGTFQFASVFETICDTNPEAPVAICDDAVLNWGDYERRAAQLATVFGELALQERLPKVAIYLHNCNEYLEAQFAAFKVGGASINVNYRYREQELVYLLDNADAEILVYHARYAPQVERIRADLPRIKLFLQVEDDSATARPSFAKDYEQTLTAAAPAPRVTQPEDAQYMIYTGGTTGMPKGVVYDQDYFCRRMIATAAIAAGREVPQTHEELAAMVRGIEQKPLSVCSCPLMHGTGMWVGVFSAHLAGGGVVTTAKLGLDADKLWRLVEQHGATDMVIVGDAFAKPLLGALDDAKAAGNSYDLSSLKRMSSSGVMWSQEVKDGLLDHIDITLVDRMGSSESSIGNSISSRGQRGGETARFSLGAGARVINDEGKDVTPGTGEIGMIATNALVPLCYYKDEDKSAATFRLVDGERYSFPGDYATVETDGRIQLLGRGSLCINTAGEKVFPEEVEEVVKQHPTVHDCLVVGIPDERFGERIVAVANLQEGQPRDEDDIIAYTKTQLAGYKAPRHVVFTEQVMRAANGKPDHKVAKQVALSTLA